MNKLFIKDSYKPAEASKWLGVSTNTIRNWCIQYDSFLSEDATPEKGVSRKFTQRDMNIFKIINDGVNRKDNHNEIAQSLIDMGEQIPKEVNAEDATPEPPQDAQDGPQQALAPSLDVGTIAPLIQALVANQVSAEQVQAMADANQIKSERIAVIEDRTKSQAGELKQVRYLMYGLLAAMILVLVLLVLVLVLR